MERGEVHDLLYQLGEIHEKLISKREQLVKKVRGLRMHAKVIGQTLDALDDVIRRTEKAELEKWDQRIESVLKKANNKNPL